MKTGVASAFLSVTWLFLRAGQAIIPHMKEGIQGYLYSCDHYDVTMTMSLLVLITLTMGGQLRAQVHSAPRPSQATDSKLCVGTLKAYKVRTRGESEVKTDKMIRLILMFLFTRD